MQSAVETGNISDGGPHVMESIKWRLGAKIVAIIDLVLIVISLVIFSLAAFVIVYHHVDRHKAIENQKQLATTSINEIEPNGNDYHSGMGYLIIFGIIFLLLFIVGLVIETIAAIALLRATSLDSGRPLESRLNHTQFWLFWSIFCWVMSLFELVFSSEIIAIVVALLFQLICIIIVFKFRTNLRKAIRNPHFVSFSNQENFVSTTPIYK